MRYEHKFFLGLLITLSPLKVMANVNALIDIGVICNSKTAINNQIIFDVTSPISGYYGKACVEKGSYITGISIKKIDLSYSKLTDSYALILHTDGAKNLIIESMSENNIMRNMSIIKNNKIIIYGIIGAPLHDGIITIGVPDKISGEKIGDNLSGKKGVPQN